MTYQAVLIDLDGVIIDNEPQHAAAFQAVLSSRGHKLTPLEYKQHFAGKTDKAGFKHFFDFIGEAIDLPSIIDDKAKAYSSLAVNQPKTYPGVIEFIRELAQRHVPLALVTGSLRAEVDAALKACGVANLFPAIICAEDVMKGKPDPEGYLKAAKALDVEPDGCVVIEDSPTGIKAAQAAGMRCAAVTNTHSSKELSDATLILDQLKPGCLDRL